MSRIHPLSVGLTFAIISVGVAAGIAAADTTPVDKTPLSTWDPVTAQQEIEAARQAVSQPQTAYLDDFNNGRRAIDKLPVGEALADFFPPSPLDDAVTVADAVVVATAQRMLFRGSGMQDIPATTVTYRVTHVVKGPLAPGDPVQLDFIGGPYRQPTGEEVFIQMAGEPIDRPGDRVLLLLQRDDAGWHLLDVASKFELRGGRVAARTERGPERAAWEGRPEAELLKRVAELAKR